MTKVNLSPAVLGRLTRDSLFWLATVTPSATPHLAPVWYIWHDERLYIFTGGIKLHNLQANPAVSLALQDGMRPVILEGEAAPVTSSRTFDGVAARYRARFAWDISAEVGPMQLIEVMPRKILNWSGETQAEELPIPPPQALASEKASPALQRAKARLHREHIIWLATVRPERRPHLVPIWHVWHQDKLYISTGEHSVKMRNIRHQPQVMLALPSAMDVVLVQGVARPAPALADELAPAFLRKFDWDFRNDSEYGALVEIVPRKILTWQGDYRHAPSRAL